METKCKAFAMALIMALSVFGAVGIGSDADAAPSVQPETGDAWGLGGSIGLDDILDVVDGSDLPFGDVTKDSLETMIENAVSLRTDYTLSDLDLDVSAEAWALMEFVERNSSGYVVDLTSAGKVNLTVSAKVSGPMPGNLEDLTEGLDGGLYLSGDDDDDDSEPVDATLTVRNAGIVLGFEVSGKAYLDNDMDLTRIVLASDVSSTVTAEIDASVDGDGNISYGKEFNRVKFSSGSNLAADVTSVGDPVQILPRDDWRGWQQDVVLSTTVTGGVYSDLPIDDDILDGLNETEVEDYELRFDVKERTVDGEKVHVVYVADDDMLGISKVAYCIPLEHSPFAKMVPKGMIVGDGLKLDAASKKTVKNGISGVLGDIEDVTSSMVLTVRYYDDDGTEIPDLRQEVKYGERIELPAYPAGSPVEEDEVFIGWETQGDIIWKEEYPVLCNLRLEAEFADRTEELPDENDFANGGSVIWDSDIDEIVDKVIDNSLLANGNTLYITVKDASGKEVYKWRLSAGPNGLVKPDTVIMPEIQKTETPAKDYLKEAAGDAKTVYLDFKASGVMPGNTVVSYYVGDMFEDGERIVVYYDNESAGTAENSGTAVVIDGYVDVQLKHCSSYMLVSAGAPGDGDSGSMLMVGIAAVVLVVVAAAAVMFVRKKNKA